MEEGHEPEPMTLEEIADFVGASAVTCCIESSRTP